MIMQEEEDEGGGAEEEQEEEEKKKKRQGTHSSPENGQIFAQIFGHDLNRFGSEFGQVFGQSLTKLFTRTSTYICKIDYDRCKTCMTPKTYTILTRLIISYAMICLTTMNTKNPHRIMLTWIADSRPGNLTPGVICRIESDAQIDHIHSLHLHLEN